MRPKLRILHLCLIVLIVGAGAGMTMRITFSMSPMRDFDHTHRYPTTAPDPGIDITAFAGYYFLGGGYGGDNLSILPNGRYSFFRSCCVGVYDRESGYVGLEGGNLVLSPLGPTPWRAQRTLLPVRWGGRCYLIPPEKIQEFCDSIIDGDEPQEGGFSNYYVHCPPVRVDGIPELPEKWAAFLRENLVIGQIIEVMEKGRVRLDLGSADGIEKGSMLAVQGREQIEPRRLQVISVQERSCLAVDPQWELADKPLQAGRSVVMPKKIGRESTSPLAQFRRRLKASDLS